MVLNFRIQFDGNFFSVCLVFNGHLKASFKQQWGYKKNETKRMADEIITAISVMPFSWYKLPIMAINKVFNGLKMNTINFFLQ